MITSVTIDFYIEKSINIISDEDFKIKRVATLDTSTDIIISDISQNKVQQLKELYESHPEVKIANLPAGDIVIVVSNRQLAKTTIKQRIPYHPR